MTVRLLHNVGYTPNNENYNTPEEINAAIARGDRLTFDGVYSNVIAYAREIDWASCKEPPILFVSGFQGQGNDFDKNMPREFFATWDLLMRFVADYPVELGWHSLTHLNLTKVSSDQSLLDEIVPPFPMKYFAYPYGAHDNRVRNVVKAAGYEKAFAVGHGDDSDPFQITRAYL